jgi:hypothetical protein
MLQNINIKYFKYLAILLAFFLVIDDAEAQRRKKKDNECGELEIVKTLPDFFVNDNFLPMPLRRVYRQDAARLALRLIYKEQRPSCQTVEIPEELVQSIYNALVAVRVSDFAVIDTIAEKYYVRSFPTPNVQYLTLIFEHNAAWAKPLKMRSDTTASVTINNIMRKYNLQVTKMVYMDEERAGLVLRAREPINVSALARKFFMDEGVGSIEEILPFGDGNDIDIALDAEGWLITYSVRFGNCIKECNKRYDWTFRVSTGGKVSYLGGKGDQIPPWIGTEKQRIEVPDKINKPKKDDKYYNRPEVKSQIEKKED